MQVKEWRLNPEETCVKLACDSGNIWLFGICEDIVRCVFSLEDEIKDESPLLIDVPAREKITVSENMETGSLEVCTSLIRLSIDLNTAVFTWYLRGQNGGEDRLLLKEDGKELKKKRVREWSTLGEKPRIRRVHTVDGDHTFIENLKPSEGREACTASLFFRWQEGEQIHGLGQGEDGIYNYRGHTQYLYQHNMRIPMPWLLSDRGYAILADCGSLMTFQDEKVSALQLDTVDQLDYYFLAGCDYIDLIKGYRYLTGKAVMLPKWAYGYVQSKERYETQEELVSVAAEYRRRQVGLDCIVQDWKTWKGDRWGEKIPDEERYPDLSEMRKQLHDLHVHSMVSVWPNMDYDTVDCHEMEEQGLLLNNLSTYNAFSREARQLYWNQAEKGLYRDGFDSWWCDSTEPFADPDWGGEEKRSPEERFRIVGDEHKKYLGEERANLYALYHARGIFENQTQTNPDLRVLNLTRSGYPGIQKYGVMLWSGDVTAKWETLRKQLTESLNMALSGYPYWTFDAGGFFVVKDNWKARGCGCNNDPTPKWFWQGDFEEGIQDPGYRELYVRWLQMAAFLPMMRSHGTDAPREIWRFGEPGDAFYDAIESAIGLRYRMMPYIYSLAGAVYFEDELMERPLLFEFPEDARAAASDEAFMLGSSLLVCPVTKPMEYGPGGEKLSGDHSFKCYLPAGSDWIRLDHFLEDREQEYEKGGQEITTCAGIKTIPAFVRSGSIIPMENSLQYAQEEAVTPFEIRICPGADAEFTLYEDAGNGFAYQKGVYNRIRLNWNEKEKTFRIGAAEFDFQGGIKGRKVKVFCHGQVKEFDYEGEEVTLTF